MNLLPVTLFPMRQTAKHPSAKYLSAMRLIRCGMRPAVLALALLPFAATAQEMAVAPGGTVRFLDKVTGRVADLALTRGQAVMQDRLTVLLDECRYPKDNPAADAQAHLTITDATRPEPVFSGWMLASSPALSAMDHPRYDIWVLSCDSGYVAPEVTEPEVDPDAPVEEINEG